MMQIRSMQAADIELGLRLCRQAKWNQLEADWRRFLAMQPTGCFVAELDGVPVATTVTCLFGPVGWIAMVLVEMTVRRQGIATALLKHALDYLDEQGARTVRLDATAAGQPVYEKLGFLAEYGLTRYEGVAPEASASPEVSEARPDQLAEIVTFDHRVTGTRREKMLTRLFEESPIGAQVISVPGGLEGYVTVRRGCNATQIGPCMATAQAGPALLAVALGRLAGRPVFLDIPRDNAAALAVAEGSGLAVQRHFVRMYRGARVEDSVAGIWAGSGPEKG